MQMSDSIGELTKALAAAQVEMPKVIKGALNPHFNSKYADLADVVGPTLPVLAKYGLAILQLPGGGIDNQSLTTLMTHVSGEWISTTMPMFVPQANPQAQMSALTYARRAGYTSMVGIAPDADDDGNAATEATKSAPPRTPYKGRIIDTKTEYPQPAGVTTEQRAEIKALLATIEITTPDDIALIVGSHIGRQLTVAGLKRITEAEAATAIAKIKEAA